MLFECLQLSAGTACCQKSRCDRNVALHILLKILSFLYRCKDLVPLFERNPAESLIFTLDFIYRAMEFTHIFFTYFKRKSGA